MNFTHVLEDVLWALRGGRQELEVRVFSLNQSVNSLKAINSELVETNKAVNAKALGLKNFLDHANQIIQEMQATHAAALAPKILIKHSWLRDGKSLQIPVQDFVQPGSVALHELLRKKKLYIKGKNFDEAIPKLYGELRKLVPDYSSDSSTFGRTEDWTFTAEILERKKDDCDGKAIALCAGLRAAGVSPEFVHVAIGETFSGIGHATVFIRDSQGTWRHLNSTGTIYIFKDLKDYSPAMQNQVHKIDNGTWADALNLKMVDYAFNDIAAFNGWNPPQNLDAYKIQ